MATFFVISTTYIGPNQHTTNDADNILDGDYYDICTSPGSTNQSKEVRIEGWLGSTNDWSLTAHGAFDTIEAARECVADQIGRPVTECRTYPATHEDDKPDDDSVVERYYASRYESVCHAGDYVGSDAIDATTSDEEIEKTAKEVHDTAEKEGIQLLGSVADWLREVRNSRKAEADEAA